MSAISPIQPLNPLKSPLAVGDFKSRVHKQVKSGVDFSRANLFQVEQPPQTPQQIQAAGQELKQKLAGADAFINEMHHNPMVSAGCPGGNCACPLHGLPPLKADVYTSKVKYNEYPVHTGDRVDIKSSKAKPSISEHVGQPASTNVYKPTTQPQEKIPPALASGTLFSQLIDGITNGVTETANQFTNTLSSYSPNTDSNATRNRFNVLQRSIFH